MLGRIVHFAEYLVVGYLNVSRPGSRKLALDDHLAEKYLNRQVPDNVEVMIHGKASIHLSLLQEQRNHLEGIPANSQW